jgi:hypothetical protein
MLETASTSSTYGAPQHTLSPSATKNTQSTKKNEQGTKPSSEANPLAAAVGAVSGSGDSHIYWLLAAMIVVTTTMVWAAAPRHSV